VLNIVAIYAVDHHHRIVTAGLLPVLVRAAFARDATSEDGLECTESTPALAYRVQLVLETDVAAKSDLEPESMSKVETLEHNIERLFEEAVGLGAINAKAVGGMRAGMASNKIDAAFCREVRSRTRSPFYTLTAWLADVAVKDRSQTEKGGGGPRC
jgi:hypothetical protein